MVSSPGFRRPYLSCVAYSILFFFYPSFKLPPAFVASHSCTGEVEATTTVKVSDTTMLNSIPSAKYIATEYMRGRYQAVLRPAILHLQINVALHLYHDRSKR
jgi:hypothetical protein